MDQRRFLSFVVLSMMVFIGWYAFVVPAFLPPAADKQAGVDAGDDAGARDDAGAADADDDADGRGEGVAAVRPGGDPDADPDPAGDEDPAAAADVAADEPAAVHPERTVILGSLDPDSGYLQQVVLTSRRAAVASIALNDPRFRELTDDDAPLRVVGNAPSIPTVRRRLADAKVDGLESIERRHVAPAKLEEPKRTLVHEPPGGGALVLRFDHDLGDAERERVERAVRAALQGTPDTLETRLVELANGKARTIPLAGPHWEVVDVEKDAAGISNAVTFAQRSRDGRLAVRKTFRLEWLDPDAIDLDDARRTSADGYTLGFEIAVENRSREPVAVAYELQGPVGVPLEDEDNARKYRDVKGAFFEGDSVDTATLSASTILSRHDDNSQTKWTQPIKYLGVDVQYFAALVVPRGDARAEPQIEFAEPELVERLGKSQFADVSVEMTSRTVDLGPGKKVAHEYGLFAGPKKRGVLAGIGATDVIDYGWFPFGYGLSRLISDSLLSVLNLLHSIGLPYGLAIVGLTIIVRGAMFPISLKQHRNMETMKALQPKIKELQTRYANDREKLGRAIMELYGEHKYNPLAGCLPMLLQLPIFLGLYQALGNAVELRMAPFLWADNLAAPDALFELPFALPFLGSSFNLLPIITIGLFLAQQKMFMPPPTDEQQEAQQKMFKYMMIFMGFLFYRVPAGLCIYFIASSLWGLGERQLLLGSHVPKTPEPKPEGDDPPRRTRGDAGRGGREDRGRKDDDGNGDGKGFLGRLLERADAAANPGTNPAGGRAPKERKARKDKGSRKTRR